MSLRSRASAPFIVVIAATMFAVIVIGQSPQQTQRDSLVMSTPDLEATLDPQLRGVTGEVTVVVRLKQASLVVAAGPDAKQRGARLTRAQQQAYAAQLRAGQNAVMGQISALGGVEIGRVSKTLNAIVVRIDAARLGAVQALTAVATIRPLIDYERSLTDTVPYVGAAAVQASGVDGTGTVIAVLDSGIDYTHKNLFGPGTVPAYAAAYGAMPSSSQNKTRDGLFPTAKVIEGFDFVGEVWPTGPLAPDPDPIDFDGHGTHVADIAAGQSMDGTHVGVAPGAKLLAVKVCSAVSTSCSGLAILMGLDFAVDPNGDNDLSDAADVINLSLGASYGQREDDSSAACANAVRFGVVVVAAAGNDADKPYIVSSPSATPEVISVAQTHVPRALGVPLQITSPASIAGTYRNTATVDFAPVNTTVTGAVAFVGRGCPAGSISATSPDDPYLSNPAGKVALIDRGACAVSLKVDRAARAGAIGVLIGLVAGGDAISFAFGGGSLFVPTLVITQQTSNLIKSQITAPVQVTYSNAVTIPLVGSMVGSSARGPNYSYNGIKPDIGAPGASVSAEVGTGIDETAFGGTSGATPMITGAVALLRQAYPTRTPGEIKAVLVNTADTNVFTNPLTVPGELAPISRIGGGELRVDRAKNSMTAAWDAGDPSNPNLSFGTHRLASATSVSKKVLVRNYLNMPRTYSIATGFRYADDAASGAVQLSHPPTITVPALGTGTFTVSLNVNPSLLPIWTLNGGSRGGDGFRLRGVEFDGYVTLSDATDTVHLPWHVLPHRAANQVASTASLSLGGTGSGNLTLSNIGGKVAGGFDAFALTGTSGKFPATILPAPGDNFAIVDLKAVGMTSFLVNFGLGPELAIQFAATTYGERSHPNYPAEFDFFLDVNQDGTDDFVVFNAENGGFGASGQNVTGLFNLKTGTTVVRFFTDADLNSANAIFSIRAADAGLTAGSQFKVTAVAFDNYFTGALTDLIGPMTVTPNALRFRATPDFGSIPVNGNTNLSITHNPAGDVASPSQKGILLLYRDAKKGREADIVTVTP
jgi:subtilisin family serine protease